MAAEHCYVLLAPYIRLLSASSPTAPTITSVLNRQRASSSKIVRKISGQSGFVVLPRRWVVERFFAWINRNRRLAKDFEATIDSARAFLYTASIMLPRPTNRETSLNFETDS
jgi:transposase